MIFNLLQRIKKNECKKVHRRYASMYTALALYDLDIYKATGDAFYLSRAMEVLNDITEDTASKGCAVNG